VTYVKICGCRTVEEALAARDAGADLIGLVFARSPRRVSPGTARRIAEALGCGRPAVVAEADGCSDGAARLERLLATRRPLLVGVFEGQSAARVESLAARTGIDVVQLHGVAHSDDLVARRPVISAIDTPSGERAASSGRAMCILDGSRGRGRLGDWDALAAVTSRLPVILAGGLTPENVAEAVRRLRPWGVDVSSGVETDGRKDTVKMRAFVATAKGAMGQ
jgi:phosphoribosylanthranilate isomerase